MATMTRLHVDINRSIAYYRTTLNGAPLKRVFLTGGSSFVPAVRQIFTRRFGQDRIKGGNEFTSVAQGLALRAAASAG